MRVLGGPIYYLLIFAWFTVCLAAGATGRELFFGVRMYTVGSGSMEPTIKSGSVVVIAPRKAYGPGEIISFWTKTEGGAQIITHRVERIGGNVYITKGDANRAADEPVEPRLVIGKVVAVIPYLGNMVEEIKSRMIIKIILVTPALMIVINELIKIWRLKKNE